MCNLKLVIAAIICTAVHPVYADTSTQSPLSTEQQEAALNTMSKTQVFQDSAELGQQINNITMLVQGIAAAADGLSQTSGSYVGVVNDKDVASLMPNGSIKSPWGSDLSISNQTKNTYTVTIPKMPQAACKLLQERLIKNSNYEVKNSCDAESSADFIYIYKSKSK